MTLDDEGRRSGRGRAGVDPQAATQGDGEPPRDAPASGDAAAVNTSEARRFERLLAGLYGIMDGLNKATSEREVLDTVLDRALELPGITGGWIFLRTGTTAFRLSAARNLPPTPDDGTGFSGECFCQRELVAGSLDVAVNVVDCERLKHTAQARDTARHHASVPLLLKGGRAVGVMNVLGSGDGLFDDATLKLLHGVGTQVAAALERTALQRHLRRLLAEKGRLASIMEATPDMVATLTLDGAVLYRNAAARWLTGLGDEDGPANLYAAVADAQTGRVLREGFVIAGEQGHWRDEVRLRRRGGGDVPVSLVLVAHRNAAGEVTQLSAIGRDITGRKRQEARLMRLNRLYGVLSGINAIIVRVGTREELYREACRILVETGRFRTVWVGVLDSGGRRVIPVEMAGLDDGFLDQATLSVDGEVEGACRLVAAALRDDCAVVCNDVAHDPRMGGWREAALERGYASVAVLPVRRCGLPVGLLALYAQDVDFFDHDEMKLLEELAADISFALEGMERKERLHHLSRHDALTDLPNREVFSERLAELIDGASRTATPLALLVIDLEKFRAINESLGRTAGDAVLRAVAGLLRRAVPEPHLVTRVSADRFAAAVPGMQGQADAADTIHAGVLVALDQPIAVEERGDVAVSARVGAALFPGDGTNSDELIRNAEVALRQAQSTGERCVFYSREFDERVGERLTAVSRLRAALDDGQLILHYQPKINLATGAISGLEALIRWDDPEHGLLSAGCFVPMLEESGMIVEVGKWALWRAMSDCTRWNRLGLSVPRVAVNVSPVQLRQDDFFDTVRDALGGTWGGAGGLELEITESVIMQDVEESLRKLETLRDLGVEVTIDDFGTGYSSLSYIARLPINALKIDRAFVLNMTDHADDLSIVSMIISLAKALNLRVVAEGVETAEQAKLLQLLKCDEMQGYLFSPAVSAREIERMLREDARLTF